MIGVLCILERGDKPTMKAFLKAFLKAFFRYILIFYAILCLSASILAMIPATSEFAYTHHKGIIAVAIWLEPGYDKGIEILSPFDNYSDSGCFIGYNSYKSQFGVYSNWF
jgi:hypothetical protein